MSLSFLSYFIYFYLFLYFFLFRILDRLFMLENADTFSSLGPLRVVLQQHVFVLEAQIKDKYPLNVCPYIYFKFAAAILR